jgi:hypothetical protein
MNQGAVLLVDTVLFEVLTEMAVGEIALGDNQYPAGVLVKPMDDTRSNWSPQVSQMAAMMEETVYQGGLPMTGSRMNHHVGRLVNRY